MKNNIIIALIIRISRNEILGRDIFAKIPLSNINSFSLLSSSYKDKMFSSSSCCFILKITKTHKGIYSKRSQKNKLAIIKINN